MGINNNILDPKMTVRVSLYSWIKNVTLLRKQKYEIHDATKIVVIMRQLQSMSRTEMLRIPLSSNKSENKYLNKGDLIKKIRTFDSYQK